MKCSVFILSCVSFIIILQFPKDAAQIKFRWPRAGVDNVFDETTENVDGQAGRKTTGACQRRSDFSGGVQARRGALICFCGEGRAASSRGAWCEGPVCGKCIGRACGNESEKRRRRRFGARRRVRPTVRRLKLCLAALKIAGGPRAPRQKGTAVASEQRPGQPRAVWP